jgi:hypothetical protein
MYLLSASASTFVQDMVALFTANSIKAQRVLTAASLYAPEHLEELSRQLFKRSWSNVRIFGGRQGPNKTRPCGLTCEFTLNHLAGPRHY